jgi:hypothetical protein
MRHDHKIILVYISFPALLLLACFCEVRTYSKNTSNFPPQRQHCGEFEAELELGLSCTPSLASECAPPPGTKVWGGHTRLQVRGWGSPNSDDWRKSLTLCLLCE